MTAARSAIPGCVYCASLPFGAEHWLPRSLGRFRGAEVLNDRICRTCNNELGMLDEELIRTGPEGTFRAMLGIGGRHDESTNPAYYRAATTNPTRILAADPDEAAILYEPFHDDGQRRGRPLRQIILEDTQGIRHTLPLNLEWNADTLRLALTRRRLTGATPVEVYVDPEETERARQLLSQAFSSFRADLFARDGEVGNKRVRFENTLARNYFRSLAKVAFHYALKHVNFWNGTETVFTPIRRFIREDEGNVDAFVLGTSSFSPFVAPKSVPVRWAHFFAVDARDDGVNGLLQFFVGPDTDYRPIFWTVRLAPVRLAQSFQEGHVAAYFDAPRDGLDGDLVSLRVTSM